MKALARYQRCASSRDVIEVCLSVYLPVCVCVYCVCVFRMDAESRNAEKKRR